MYMLQVYVLPQTAIPEHDVRGQCSVHELPAGGGGGVAGRPLFPPALRQQVRPYCSPLPLHPQWHGMAVTSRYMFFLLRLKNAFSEWVGLSETLFIKNVGNAYSPMQKCLNVLCQ